MKLKEVEGATFGFFIHWLYIRRVPRHEENDEEIVGAFYYGEGSRIMEPS